LVRTLCHHNPSDLNPTVKVLLIRDLSRIAHRRIDDTDLRHRRGITYQISTVHSQIKGQPTIFSTRVTERGGSMLHGGDPHLGSTSPPAPSPILTTDHRYTVLRPTRTRWEDTHRNWCDEYHCHGVASIRGGANLRREICVLQPHHSAQVQVRSMRVVNFFT
jgi:hypothetical protein